MITSFITTLVLLVVLPTTLFNTSSVSNDLDQSCMVFNNDSLTRMGLSSLDGATESTKSLVLLNGVYAARPPIRRCDITKQKSILALWGVNNNEAADNVEDEEEQGGEVAAPDADADAPAQQDAVHDANAEVAPAQQGAANADANVDINEEADDDSSDANVDAAAAESSAVQVGTATNGEDSDDDSISDEELHEMYAVCASQKGMTVPQYIEYLRSLEDEDDDVSVDGIMSCFESISKSTDGRNALQAAVAALKGDRDVDDDGRCGLRAGMSAASEAGIPLIYEEGGQVYRFEPHEIDFRFGNDLAAREAFAIAMRAYARRYMDWFGHEANINNVVQEIDNGVHEWFENIMNADLETPDNWGLDYWVDNRILIGMALHHNIDIDLYDGLNNAIIPVFHHDNPNGDTITLGWNGVNHFDLRNEAAHWNQGPNIDELLWPEDTNPFRHMYEAMPPEQRQRIVNFVRRMIQAFLDMDHDDAHKQHLAGVIPYFLSPDVAVSDEAILRIIGRYPPFFFEMLMAPGFRGDRMCPRDLERLRDEAARFLDPNDQGGEYIRYHVGRYVDIRRTMERFLQGHQDGFVHMPNFCRGWLDRNEGLHPDTPCSIPYFGEVSSGTVVDRHRAEDDPNVRDGAQHQWEFFQIFKVLGFIVAFVRACNKKEAWILEAFTAGMVQMATIATLSSAVSAAAGTAYFALQVLDFTALNAVNCGRPWFLDHLFGSKFVVDWLKKYKRPTDLLSKAVGVPAFIWSFIEYNLPRMLAYFSDPSGRFRVRWPFAPVFRNMMDIMYFLTVEQFHSFVGHLGGTANAAAEGYVVEGGRKKSRRMQKRGREGAAAEGYVVEGGRKKSRRNQKKGRKGAVATHKEKDDRGKSKTAVAGQKAMAKSRRKSSKRKFIQVWTICERKGCSGKRKRQRKSVPTTGQASEQGCNYCSGRARPPRYDATRNPTQNWSYVLDENGNPLVAHSDDETEDENDENEENDEETD